MANNTSGHQFQEVYSMFRARFVCLLLLAALALGLVGAVQAVEVDCDTAYCFSPEDFASGEEALAGICITDLMRIRESLQRKQIVVIRWNALNDLAVVPGLAFVCLAGIISRIDETPFASDIDRCPRVIGRLIFG
jgi:hypothetical protein